MGITKISAVCVIAFCAPVSAAVKYWDVNGASPGAGGPTPAGTWDQGTTSNWTLSAPGDTATTTFTSGDTAIFAAADDATGSYLVNVSTLVNPSGGLIIKNGAVTLGGSGSIALAAGTLRVTNGATVVYGSASKFLVSAGNALVLDNGTVKITNALTTTLWSSTGELRLGPGGGVIEVNSGSVATYTGAGGIGLTPGTTEATLTKTGPGEFRPQTGSFTRLVVNQGLWRIPGTGGLETGLGAVPASFTPDALTINGGAVGSSAVLLTPSSRGITLGPGGATFVLGAAWTIQSTISGPGGLALNGNGFAGSPSQVLTLSSVNTYQGSTVINLGVLSAGNDSNLGQAPPNPVPNALVLGGGTFNVSHSFTLHPNRGIQVSAPSVIDVTTAQSLRYDGLITGAGLTKSGGGELTLGGSNSFTGDFTLAGGRLNLNHDHAAGSGKLILSPGTQAILGTTSEAVIITNPIVANSGSSDLAAEQGTRLALPGSITGSAALTCGNSGTGTVVLAGSNTLWTGGLDLRGGTLELGHLFALGTGPLTVSGTSALMTRIQASLDLAGPSSLTNSVLLSTNLTVGGSNQLELAGPINLGVGLRELTVQTPALIVSGSMAGSGAGLTKTGPGTLKLTANNSYQGSTTVEAGALELGNVAGSATGTGPILIGASGTLSGAGSASGAVTLDGTLAPGDGPGRLTTGEQTWAGGARYVWELQDPSEEPGVGWDQVLINGPLSISADSNAPFTLSIRSLDSAHQPGALTNFDAASDQAWVISSASGGIVGFAPEAFVLDFSGFSNSLAGGQFFLTTEQGTNLVLHFKVNHAPVANDDAVFRPRGVGMKMRRLDLLLNDSDPDSGAPIFLGVDPLSTNQATITTDSTYVYYQPANGSSACDVVDRFSYRIGDGFLTSTGHVVVNIAPDSPAPAPNLIGYALAPDGNLGMTFAGVPGRSYLVQATESLVPPISWQTLTNNLDGSSLFIAGTNGLWTHTDLNSTNFGIRFYRSTIP